MSWTDLEIGNPDLASFGAARFGDGVAYLATVREDGSPRIHPVTPIAGEGRLFLFMEPTSPKGKDLRRDGRYALHSAVDDSGGSNGEFLVEGRAEFVEEPAILDFASSLSSYPLAERYVLFELSVEGAMMIVYEEGLPVSRRWKNDPEI